MHPLVRSRGLGAATKVIPLRLHPAAAAAVGVAAPAPAASAGASSPPWTTGEKVAVGAGVGLVALFLLLAFQK